jgi:long-chain acyl-CoA synthetase
MVIGEGEKFPSALIVPSFAFVKEWATRKGLDFEKLSNEEIAAHPKLHERINQEVSTLNKEYGNWEQIKKFVLLPKEFSIDGDELTPTLKLKRKKILAKYQKEYKSIYCD